VSTETSIEVSGVPKRFGSTVALDGMTFAVLLSERNVPFCEVSAHRASLEEACLELTRDAVRYRAGQASGGTR
jgi:ABC-2 type transport system ATP-binding protein